MLAPGDKRRLKDVGFLPFEIEAYDKSPTFHNIDNDQWQTMMRNRKDWMMRMIDDGAVKEDIEEAIEHWYKQSTRRTPWDWLRMVGSPTKARTTRIKDYTASLQARQRARALSKESEVPYPGTYKRRTRVSW